MESIQILSKDEESLLENLTMSLGHIENELKRADSTILKIRESSDDLMQKLLIERHSTEVIEGQVTQDIDSSISSYIETNTKVNDLTETVEELSGRCKEVSLQHKEAKDAEERIETNAKTIPVLKGVLGAGLVLV